MAQQRHVVVLLVLACLFTSSYSSQYTVGGKDGWVLNPSVDYNTWSQHMRFIINDSVLFKYKQGADSVLEVSKDDYDKCNTGNPIKKMEDGNSIFTLDRSGPFYFISGNKDNCDKGQKLQIIVISVRNQTPAPGVAPPTSPPKGSSTPGSSPPKGSSTPGTPSAPSANAPAGSSTPGASSPNGAPVSTPAGKSPTSSPTPSGSTASPPAPATGGSVAPAMSPVANGPSTSTPGSSSPVAGGPSSGSGIAPSAGGPSGSGIAPTAGGPAGSMSPGPSAGGLAGGPSAGAPGSSASGSGGSNTPADINSPAGAPENPNSFAVKAFTPSIVLVSAVSLVLTVALGEFIILP
ncbi:early nodulin-like protein 2 [Solanum verrucosum]|uniref:early nodulin-like protein 2 n=1 Tax=Solanum verrucosum TaxID=315347 RepID=UPI0020D1CC57|nr:early nodulin-like protein 2 [Solanum verrucosum]